MIHQFIFAAPRPGMTEAEFQRYWLQVHAPQYASKILQIRKYCVDTRVSLPEESGEPLWSGVAEIWLQNEKEQIESLQSKEFLEGARRDEPNWAAFWRTVVLDTTAHILLSEASEAYENGMFKLLVLSKRKEGLPLEGFRACFLGPHATRVATLPGLYRYSQGHVRDSFYTIGEAVLDCVEQLWFDSLDAASTALHFVQSGGDYQLFVQESYLHTMLVQEHWIIGPEPRPYKG
jgi:uncharacterized protein (TIGR02118 family)